jgi:hypothetical protein
MKKLFAITMLALLGSIAAPPAHAAENWCVNGACAPLRYCFAAIAAGGGVCTREYSAAPKERHIERSPDGDSRRRASRRPAKDPWYW